MSWTEFALTGVATLTHTKISAKTQLTNEAISNTIIPQRSLDDRCTKSPKDFFLSLQLSSELEGFHHSVLYLSL
ncbi:hypothetical protein Hanom_Chr14g01249181 [Helianthus anomalus]